MNQYLLSILGHNLTFLVHNLRKGREYCNDGVGPHPLYVNVDLTNGDIANSWIDSLQAAFPGVQVLFGDLGRFWQNF